MPNKKITDLTELAVGSAASTDVLPIADISAGETKKIPFSTLRPQITMLRKTADQAVSTSTWTTVTWDAEDFDEAGTHDNVTNNTRITIPAGFTKARLTSGIVWPNSSSGGRGIIIVRNGGSGNNHVGFMMAPAQFESGLVADSGWITVAENDYFEVSAFAGATSMSIRGPSGNWGGRSFFMAELYP